VRLVFSTYGEITKLHVMPPHKENGRVAAFVYYSNMQSGQDAISVLDGQYKIRADAEAPIQVKWAMTREQKGMGKGGCDGWGAAPAVGWTAGGGSLGGGKGGSDKCRTQDGWKLFVGGLPRDCTEEELNTVFSTYGAVRKVLVLAPHAVSGRVAAFVFYEAEQSADDAIMALHDVYKIRADAEAPITVKWGTDRGGKGGKAPQTVGWSQGQGQGQGSWSQGGGGGGGGYGGGGAWQGGGCGAACANGWQGGKGGYGGGGKGYGGGASDTKLFVGNLPPDITEDSLRYVFSTYGTVTNIHLMLGRSQTGSACAFVEFTQAADAETAILTLNDKYEIKPGSGVIMVKKAKTGGARAGPY